MLYAPPMNFDLQPCQALSCLVRKISQGWVRSPKLSVTDVHWAPKQHPKAKTPHDPQSLVSISFSSLHVSTWSLPLARCPQGSAALGFKQSQACNPKLCEWNRRLVAEESDSTAIGSLHAKACPAESSESVPSQESSFSLCLVLGKQKPDRSQQRNAGEKKKKKKKKSTHTSPS